LVVYREPVTGPRFRRIVNRHPLMINKLTTKPIRIPIANPYSNPTLTLPLTLPNPNPNRF